jgi:TetR/AcrR family transcriptional repressor of nem operon
VGEFGTSDPEISALRAKVAPLLGARLVERLLEGQAKGEINPDLKAEEAAGFIQLMMTGIQVAARAGVGAKDLKRMARFAADRLLANE